MSNYGIYPGKELMIKTLPEREWIIKDFIREKDAVLWVGQEKSGKTLFSMQAFLCCLTSGYPLLEKYDIPVPKKVTYILLEGDLAESINRIKRLANSTALDEEKFCFMYLPRLMLNNRQGQFGLLHLIDEIKKKNCHEVVVIDPLYRSFTGSMCDDKIVREVVSNLDELKEILGCTLVVIHHTHKKKFDIKGKQIIEGDDATFGSVWFKAWASHIIMQIYDQQANLRSLYCNTQRSGDIEKECNLVLVEPNPLYFKLEHEIETKEGNCSLAILNLLKQEEFKEGLTREGIEQRLGITKSGFYYSIKYPIDFIGKGIIGKNNDHRPTKYYYNKNNNVELIKNDDVSAFGGKKQ